MANDNESRYVIAFDGDAGDIKSVLAALKGQIRSEFSDIQTSLKNIDLFQGLQKGAVDAGAALERAKQNVVTFTGALNAAKASGSDATEDLQKSLRAAQTQLTAATREVSRNEAAIVSLGAKLKTAGVDVGNLAGEQLRLAEASRVAAAALVEQNAKLALGFKSFRDIQVDINRVNAAFISLRDSGKLSFGELSVAQARLAQQVGQLRAQASGLGQAFSDIRGRVLAFTAAFAGVGVAASTAARNFRDFAQAIAAVDSIADVSKLKIEQLAAGVRELSIRMGVDAVQSAKALYEIISSGIPADNALTVLEQATRAAIAGMTDVDTAARVGVAVLNGYGLEVNQLAHVYDVLFQTVKDGVVTFPELAKNIGQVIPAARAAKVPLEELGAAFVVLTRQGIDAPEAATSINRAIIDLSAPAPAAADRLRALGIEVKGLFGTIEQIASRKLTLSQLADIVPDVRAQRAVLTLAQNFRLLRDELGEMNKDAAQTQAAYLKLANTPQAQVNRFNSAMKDLSISIGEFVTGSGGAVVALTGMINAFNSLSGSTKTTVFELAAGAAVIAGLVVIVRQLAIPINLLAGALTSAAATGAAAAGGLTAASVAMGALNLAIAGFLGFKFGEQLSQQFAPVRRVGDLLGTFAGAFVNLADFGIARFRAALTGSAAAADQATAAFNRNKAILGEQWNAIMTGAVEKLRQLENAHTSLVAQLAKTSAAAVDAASNLDAGVSRLAATVGTQLAGVDQFVTALQARLQALSASLTQQVAAVQANAQNALANLTAVTSAQVDQLGLLQEKEIQNTRDTVAIQTAAAAQRLAILKKFAVDALDAFNAEATARLEIAKRTGEQLGRVELDIAKAKRTVLQGLVDAYRANVNELVGIEQGHLDKIKALQDQRLKINEDIEDKIRDVSRQTLGVYQQYADRVEQIDENIAKARAALSVGDLKKAEEYANKAIGFVDGISKAVVEQGKVIVSDRKAEQNATDALRAAQEILVGVTDKRIVAEKEAAEATKTSLGAASEQLQNVQQQLIEINELVSKGIAVQLTADASAVTSTIEKLDTELTEQEHLLKVKADITEAQVEIKRLKDELEQGVTVNVTARTEKIEEALNRVRATAPELDIDVKEALASLATVKAAADKLAEIQVEIKTNVDEVRAAIDSLNGRNTESTHTIHVVTVNDNAAGGLIGGTGLTIRQVARDGGPIVQRFATGGGVGAFQTPPWSKVPGTGDADTVPAGLPVGSFVLRKAASQYYGDGLLQQLAGGVRFFALGGKVFDNFRRNVLTVKTPVAALAPGKSLLNAQTIAELGGSTLSSDPGLHDARQDAERVIGELIAAAKTLPSAQGRGQSLADYLSNVLEAVRAAPDAATVQALLKPIEDQFAEYMASIIAARSYIPPVPIIMGALAPGLAPDPNAPRKPNNFAEGGGARGTDTVRAMLTPGEWVINPARVAAVGAGFMYALNSLAVPRARLAEMLAPPTRYFAEGGPVGDTPAPAAVATGGTTTRSFAPTINLNASVADIFTPENVKRFLLPILDDYQRRT